MSTTTLEALSHGEYPLTSQPEGEPIMVIQAGEVVGYFVPTRANPLKKRRLGTYAGQIRIAEDFDAPLLIA